MTGREDIIEALRDWRGCGCCSSTEALTKIIPDDCEEEDGWTDHTYGSGCVAGISAADLLPLLVAKWQEVAGGE
jgi:hypothetical protein